MANVAKDLAQIITQSGSNKTGPYDTQAKVKRIEGNTVWVSIPGGIDETPIDKTVNCSVGDNVQVRVSGGRAWITGNATAPPTDDTTAIKADTTANKAQVIAVDAKETAEAVEGIAVNASTTATTAKTIAEGVNEHFWHDNTGAHVTEVTQEEWNDSSDPNYHSGGNTLITTQGMAIRNGLDNLAQFGSTGAVIGEVTNGNSRTEISTSGMQIYQKVSGNDVSIANLGYGPGTDSGGGTTDAPYYTLGERATGNTYFPAYDSTATYKKGDKCTYNSTQYVCKVDINSPEAWNYNHWVFYIGNYSIAEGVSTTASGSNSHAEGSQSTAVGTYSHAEGGYTTASRSASHAEGNSTTASGNASHAEGQSTTASGDYSHAEGQRTTASGFDSHAEGYETTAKNTYSHTQNYGTYADQQSQTAIGEYNTKNNTNNLFVIGNGTADNARSDAFEVDTSGNVKLAGSIQSFFKIVELAVETTASIAAHSYQSNATYTVPSADRPAGMTLVGVVGWGASNFRLYASTVFVNGSHTISVTIGNSSATSVAAGATITFRLLYAKVTSA